MRAMELALFDLDHTLIPFDSGSVFTRFLASRGALPDGFAAEYLAYCQRYAAGSVDMVAMHRFTVGALAAHAPQQLRAWIDEFASTLPPLIPAAARALVDSHRSAGHRCLLVTATTRLVAEPFAHALGFDIATELLPTEPAHDARGHVSGEIIGEPCFREHKVTHVLTWLQRSGLGWADVTRSWFYSDSANDLPLLDHVSDPVAVNADPRLAGLAEARGWGVREIKG
jgi:HAD superfamily hydrolase (TIGR01490 family)